MLKRLHLRNFTVFEDADFEFGPGLNVIVGANGTGKSHVLKAGYAMLHRTIVETERKLGNKNAVRTNINNPDLWSFAAKIRGIFQTNASSNADALTRHGVTGYNSFVEAQVASSAWEAHINNRFIRGAPDALHIYKIQSHAAGSEENFMLPVFIPAKEVLTMGWLLPLYARREIPIDQTYPDLLRLLMGPPLRQPEPAHIVAHLQQLIGGKVEEEGGHFYLSAPEQPRMEMNMVAEGFRKFATLYKLLANGTLTPETTLFWDEPEANLNPALLKDMAAVLTELAKAGFQIILATHSLFLLKELHILAQQAKQPVRYFSLSAEPGGATTVATADTLTALPNLVALDIEMAQSDLFLDVLNHEEQDADA